MIQNKVGRVAAWAGVSSEAALAAGDAEVAMYLTELCLGAARRGVGPGGVERASAAGVGGQLQRAALTEAAAGERGREEGRRAHARSKRGDAARSCCMRAS